MKDQSHESHLQPRCLTLYPTPCPTRQEYRDSLWILNPGGVNLRILVQAMTARPCALTE